MASNIGLFYAMQGIVSLFMPALIGIIADRWIEAQRLLGICHGLAALFMFGAGYYAMTAGDAVAFAPLFTLYALSVAFYMPTIALANSVAYSALEKSNLDPVRAFPPIRVWGTVGFICAMLVCDFAGFQTGYAQFMQCGVIGIVLAVYAFTLPQCPIAGHSAKRGVVDALGLRAFTLFRDRRMAIFFIFSMLLGVSLQITNGFANPFLTSYRDVPEYMYKRQVHTLDDNLRRGLRLLQHLWLALRERTDRCRDPLLGSGAIHDDDKRHRRHHRYARRAGRRQPFRI